MHNWTDIVRSHGPVAYRVAWRILGQQQDCEDVVQDAFIEVYKKYEIGEVEHWKSFINRVVTYRAIDLLRRRRSLQDLDSQSVPDSAPSAESVAIVSEEVSRLRGLVAELPDRQAAVFCLIHFEQLSHQDVADTLNISRNAVSMALLKARNQLQRQLQSSMGDSTGE